MREKPGISQTRFAALMGTARTLLRVAESHPEAVLEALQRRVTAA